MKQFSRARKALTLLSSAAVAVSGFTLLPASIAAAAPSEKEVLPSANAYGFTDPSGTNWTVPSGVNRVVVALQGGTGGRGAAFSGTPDSWLGHGSGDDFLVNAEVKPGDVLTIYAGRHATGKKDGRDGGAGFISGGTGGKGSLDGKNAGGGGGAAALKINGDLIAVAGGGGGGGGDARSWVPANCLAKTHCSGKGHYDNRLGGIGGSAAFLRDHPFTDNVSPGTGGKNPGEAGEQNAKSGTPGGNGSSAGFSTASGGGGGGGGGWPTSGTGAGAGKGFMSSNAGGGGGAGKSWLKHDARYSLKHGRTNAELGMWRPGADLTDENPSGIIIPVISQTSLTGPMVVGENQPFALNMRASQSLNYGKAIHGSYSLSQDGDEISKARTNGIESFWIDGLTAGSHEFHVSFTPDAISATPAQGATLFSKSSSARLTVQVIPQTESLRMNMATLSEGDSSGQDVTSDTPEEPGASEDSLKDQRDQSESEKDGQDPTLNGASDGAGTSEAAKSDADAASARDIAPISLPATTTSLNMPTSSSSYGAPIVGSITVTLDGPANLTGRMATLTVDGVDYPTPLLYIGSGSFLAVAVFPTLNAGMHAVSARFDGTDGEVIGSVSETQELTILPEATSVRGFTAPTSARAFEPIDVTATITAADPVRHPSVPGQVELQADGVPFAYGTVGSDGVATFEDVVPPVNATSLSVAYSGDVNGNFEQSVSSPSPFTVIDVETETALVVSPASIQADEAAHFVVTVRNIDDSALSDPRGEIEILLDDEEILTIPAGLDVDEDRLDGDSRYEITADNLPLGEHEIVARFVPADGFGASESGAQSLAVLGVETSLKVTPEYVSVAVGKAATAQLEVTTHASPDAQTASSTDGYVQAFRDDAPIGDPALITNGSGTLKLPVLAVGTHDIELRFTPANEGHLKSSATMQVTVKTAPAAQGNALSNTGANDPRPAVLTLGALLLVAAGLLAYRRFKTTRQ